MTKLKCYTYRIGTSANKGEWEYIFTYDSIEEVKNRLTEENNWSEHFRGVEIKPCYRPPKNVILSYLREVEYNIFRYEQLKKEMLNKYSKRI